MPAKAKVGSWLDKSNGEDVDEAYESSGDEGSSTRGKAQSAEPPLDDGESEDEDEGEIAAAVESKREAVVDWETVIPRIRPSLEDQSAKRRRAFIDRYLYVDENSPPSANIPAVVSSILQALPHLTSPDQADDAVNVVKAILIRDDKSSGGKLGNNFVKWIQAETDKITASARSVTISVYLPYLFLTLGVLAVFKTTREPLQQLVPTPESQELLSRLAYLIDAIEAKDVKGKENAKLGRARRKAYIRLWRGLRDYRDVLPDMLRLLLTKSVSTPSRYAVLIGHIAGVMMRLRPKGAGESASGPSEDGIKAVKAEQDALVNFYTTHIIGAKTGLPRHIARAFDPILPHIITQQLLIDKLIPAAERMLLRAPENTLELTAELLRSSGLDISSVLPAKLIPSTLSASKSSNPETRAKSVILMQAICESCQDAATRARVITEVLSLAKSGKTTSAEHRSTLFQMSAAVAPSEEVSPIVLETLLPLIAKEGNEAALGELCASLKLHMAYLLQSGVALSPVVISTLGKELVSTKIGTRRALSDAVGQAIWTVSEGKPYQFSAEGMKLLETVIPALEANLQTAMANVPSNPTGFLEGYVSAALALGPLQDIQGAEALITAARSLKVVSPKPSFILNERVYGKIPSGKDELWMLRSLEGMIQDAKASIPAEPLRVSIGAAMLHLVLRAGADTVRSAAIKSLPNLAITQPTVVHAIARDGVHTWLTAQDAAFDPLKVVNPDEGEPSGMRTQKIGQLLEYLFSSAQSQAIDKVEMQEFAVEMLIIAHHPLLTEGAHTSWINLVTGAGLDAADLAVERREKITTSLWTAAEASGRSRFPQAAYRAITTLTFVQPTLYVPAFMDQIRSDLDPANLDFIGLSERGIWISPPDQPYVDVLSQKKDANENKNRRDYATEKWEEEIRESVAKKRAAAGNVKLSKADQAAVNAQLAKEADVRTRISAVQSQMVRGLEVVAALTASNAVRVEREVGELAQILLASAFSAGSFLLDRRAFEVMMGLSTLATDRLGEYRRLLIAAILRSHNAPLIPDDYTEESVQNLVTRLLHQLLFVASQKPLDSTTYALTSVLFGRIVKLGGAGVDSPQSEEAQEQLTLIVNIISACSGEFGDDAYPRLQTISHLQNIISKYPRLAKDASAALVDLGSAIQDNAEPEEVKVMISGTMSSDYNVRSASLQALQPVDLTDLDYSLELWIATHDADEQSASLALHLWEDNGLDLPETYLSSLLGYLAHESPAVRISTAGAIAAAAQQFPSQIEPTISGLELLYAEKAKPLQPEFDRFGMVIPETVNRQDPFESRVAIALALERITPLLSNSLVEPIINFMVFGEALGDRNSAVRKAMLEAATAIVDRHGGKSIATLMLTFEDYLGRSTPSSETDDYIKEAVVILFGRLAGHLDTTDPRIPKVVDRLVEALNTPSELVQSAVADCLPPLVNGMGEEVEYLVDKLFSTLTTGVKYAGRRGAAYGLAGVVKGRGLGSLKEYELMDKLKDAAEDRSTYQSRQGAVFAFETLSTTLGKTFEPYIISIVPLLLVLFGDTNTDVREAVQDASKVIMSKVSGHCVKLMLPDLLDALEEKQWRTKKGAIELLGAMAFCAPKQLSLSLPTIIPHLTGVINDSHAQVKSAANTSLKRFGEVLENPEVKAMQSTLMKALADPTAKTANALAVLLKTRFEHYLDAPSLALVMPIIDRGLRQRSSETRRKSVQIVGNMASLTESRDLVPYLDALMPLVHQVLVDPVPEARATAAKSLGTLVERLGEANFPDLVEKLTNTLKADSSGVDRQGAAQGLSEVLSGLGMERLENMLPEIVASTSSPRPYVREGFISLLVYLPATFGHRFTPHLGRVIPPILSGLADDSEYVREASMRAGKMIIANYSNKAIDLLLPELEKGMLDSAWRIRQSSISLTGELLYRVTGISGKVELEEEEAAVVAIDNARKALLEALGQERRDRVLATLYIVRQDAIGIVRQASIHIWKALVQNTPRTTREILPVLMQILMSLLGSDESEQQETASRTLGELCRKNGDRIFGEIIPILQKAISSPDARSREGACLAFADVMAAANRETLSEYEDQIIAAIRKALVDPESSVRTAAAQTFDTAQQFMGAKAVDQTIPTLLEAMRNPGEASETALQALKEVMSVRANSVFPVLIPSLTVQPITAFNARALGALVKVAGSALNKRLDTVLGALVKSLEKEKAEDVKEELLGAIESLLSSVVDADGVHQLEMLLIGWNVSPAKDKDAVRRATASQVFGTLCQVSTADTTEYRVDWIRILVTAFDDPVPEVVDSAWQALEFFVKTIDKDELEDLVVPLRRAIESTGAPGKHVAGFSRPKGVQSIVPILLAGVLSGTQEQREQAALGVGDLVQRTSEVAIKPYIIQLTGPLIRVISGQGLAPQIKSAILLTLTVLLEEVPQLVRPFHPQLTRTFVKSASDPAALSVRNRAAAGLGELMKHQPRVDPLITELVGGVRSAEKDIAPSVVQALAAVCSTAGKNIGGPARASIIELVEEAFAEPRGESFNTAIAKVVAGLAKNDPESIRSISDTFLTAPMPPTALVSITILTLLEDAPAGFHELDITEEIIDKIKASIAADQSAVSRPAREARDLVKEAERWRDDPKIQAAFR